MAWHCVFAFNFAIVAFVYGSMYRVLYYHYYYYSHVPSAKSNRSTLQKLKYNPEYPEPSLVSSEIQRTFTSVAICCCLELLIATVRQWEPLWFAVVDDGSDWITSACTVAGLLAWIDTHFYFSHRLLHEVPMLYRRIHKVHHESTNPDPWSGLSFHPLEAALYFSSLTIACILPVPQWAFCLHKTALLLAPANGHHGHEVPLMPWLFSSENHYLHHARFNCNYGSPTSFWDWVFGTQCTRVPPPIAIKQAVSSSEDDILRQRAP